MKAWCTRKLWTRWSPNIIMCMFSRTSPRSTTARSGGGRGGGKGGGAIRTEYKVRRFGTFFDKEIRKSHPSWQLHRLRCGHHGSTRHQSNIIKWQTSTQSIMVKVYIETMTTSLQFPGNLRLLGGIREAGEEMTVQWSSSRILCSSMQRLVATNSANIWGKLTGALLNGLLHRCNNTDFVYSR